MKNFLNILLNKFKSRKIEKVDLTILEWSDVKKKIDNLFDNLIKYNLSDNKRNDQRLIKDIKNLHFITHIKKGNKYKLSITKFFDKENQWQMTKDQKSQTLKYFNTYYRSLRSKKDTPFLLNPQLNTNYLKSYFLKINRNS